MNKLIILSAPSGSGKTTLVKHLIENEKKIGVNFSFSISATSRKPRGQEINGKDYHFLTSQEFKKKIANNEFIEWEEVYKDVYYGTLKSEVENANKTNRILIFDVDVVGGVNLKSIFKNNSLSIFIQPPSIASLKKRLIARSTDSLEIIQKRLDKAEFELTFSNKFDTIIVNDNLSDAKNNILSAIQQFL